MRNRCRRIFAELRAIGPRILLGESLCLRRAAKLFQRLYQNVVPGLVERVFRNDAARPLHRIGSRAAAQAFASEELQRFQQPIAQDLAFVPAPAGKSFLRQEFSPVHAHRHPIMLLPLPGGRRTPRLHDLLLECQEVDPCMFAEVEHVGAIVVPDGDAEIVADSPEGLAQIGDGFHHHHLDLLARMIAPQLFEDLVDGKPLPMTRREKLEQLSRTLAPPR